MASVRDRAGHEVDGGQRENGGGAAAGQKNAILLQETDGAPPVRMVLQTLLLDHYSPGE
jgi:hypothetical protein